MPRILSAFEAVTAASSLKLKQKEKLIVDDYSKKLLVALPKAHEPRGFELTVNTMLQQLDARKDALKKIKVGISPLKAYRRSKERKDIEAASKLIKTCTTGDFNTNYASQKQELLAFLARAKVEKFMLSESSFLDEIHDLLQKDDLSIIYLLEEHLEKGKFKDEYRQQFQQLIILMKLKAAYNPKPISTPHLKEDTSLLLLEGEIEQRRMQAAIDGDTKLANALKYLAIGCHVSTAKSNELRTAILQHGKNMQAYKHHEKCFQLGGRLVMHCSQAMMPGIGLESGFCFALSNLWAEQLIKNDKFLGFRGNQVAHIQPADADARILQAIPSFNDFVRVDSELLALQKSQNVDEEHDYDEKPGADPKKLFEDFSQEVLAEANKNSDTAIFCGYYTDSGARRGSSKQ